MATEEKNNQLVESLSLDDKLFTVRRKPLAESHIKIDRQLCSECLNRICTYICPAEVYLWDEAKNEIDVRFENCLECGACRIACDGIDWSNPAWGTGIAYKNS